MQRGTVQVGVHAVLLGRAGYGLFGISLRATICACGLSGINLESETASYSPSCGVLPSFRP